MCLLVLTNGDHQLEDDVEGAAQLSWRHLYSIHSPLTSGKGSLLIARKAGT